MANQIVISSGAKVRNLSGVLTGTAGVVDALGINVANGIPQLDGSGKILVSQLPNSVMEYKGTWNAATNTPTLVNGTGNQGDVYLCNVAGTVNFGAGAITFAVGDQAIYSGTIWQKAGGSTGTVTSVAITETGDALTITGSPITTSGTINIGFAGISGQYVNGAGGLTTFPTLLSSVGLSMPSAFSVANSPLTANGTIAVTGAGVASQYVRGDGTLANFPTSGGGGSSVAYYFNGSVNQGTFGGNTYYEMSKVPVIGAGTDFSISSNGYISQFITDANDPALLEIPAGNWNFEMYFSANSGGGTPSFYVELYKYNGTTFTLIASSSAAPEGITNGTAIDLYNTALAVPLTSLTLTDRLAVRVYVNNSGRTITLHTENSHLCEVITTFSTGITAINGLTAQVQFLATGTSGTDFNISSSTATHTFNLPVASATNTGKLSSTDWSTFNSKQNTITLTTTGTSGAATLVGATLNIPNYGSALSSYVPYTGATNDLNLGSFFLTANQIDGKTLRITTTGTLGGTIALEAGTTGVQGGAGSGITLYADSNTSLLVRSSVLSSSFKQAKFQLSSITTNQTRTYTLPDANGTIALTSDLSSYVPYTGATANLDLGTFDFTTDIATLNQVKAVGSGGISFNANGGTQIALMGAGGGANMTLYGGLTGTSGTFSANGSSFGSASAGSYPLTIQTNVSEQSIKFIGKNDNNNIQFFDSAGTTYQAVLGTIGSSFYIGTGTSGSERMRITSGGLVAIGTTSALINESSLAVTSNGNTATFKSTLNGGNCLLLWNSGGTGNIVFGTGSSFTAAGSITSSGTVTSYNTTSDYRLKQDLKDYNGLDLVSAIKTYDYEWKSDKKRMYGVVAHELQEVLPYAVQGEKDAKDMQQVDYSKIVPILVKAIQELKLEIEQLKNK